MRRFYFILLSFVLLLGVSPSISFAMSPQDLSDFLEREGLTEVQLTDLLSNYWELTPNDFETSEDLEALLGERITDENLQQLLEINNIVDETELTSLLVKNQKLEEGADLRTTFVYISALENTISFMSIIPKTDENLQQLLDTYGLTIDELNQIFNLNNDSLDNYEFIEDIEMVLINYGVPITEHTLDTLLNNFGLSLEQLNQIFSDNNDSLNNYDNIDDLVTKLLEYGIPITDQNFQDLLNDFEITQDQFEALMLKYDDAKENYQTIDELYMTVFMYMLIEESDEFLEELGIGLDKIELKNLVKHFQGIDMTDPVFAEKMAELENRLIELGEFESPADLTEEQKTVLVNTFQEMMGLYQLQAQYYLVKGTERIPVSYQELLTMKITKGYDLAVELYNTDGLLLADINLTAELLGFEIIEEIENEINTEKETITNPVNVKSEVQIQPVKQQNQSGTGERLPDTAGNSGNGILIGLGLAMTGVILFRKQIVKQS
ncbi:processed acidic surface protein [Bacillus sp. DNRA2]|uniref:processed acidic surface protein n=1 Tax=Bacillus sp. DNRA2 TaxID=2723053 RepID=UPI00145F48F7|nr:processed acidic surface protein [Bacillus sp. DNRA2]NMD69770.1 processed acidic surface protein [Bacillus sp. DNRA2]